MYAVIETGGKQYRLAEGDVLQVEKLAAQPGELVVTDRVLAIKDDSGFRAGNPWLTGAQVKLEVLEQGRGRKVTVFKYKAKKNYRRKQGHRQPYTKVKVVAITV